MTAADTDGRPLCFVHIPKTGGSTLRWILDRQYQSCMYLIPQWFHGDHTTPSVAAGQCRGAPAVIGAHRPLDASWPQGLALAMVRDPLRRVLSHVAHIRAEPQAWLPDARGALPSSLADWMDRKPLALFDNNQVRYLSGAVEFDGMPLTRTMEESDLEKALQAARSRVLVAPMEAFDEALLDWRHRLRWSPPYYRRVNVRRRGSSPIPERDTQAVASWNRLDRILCEEVGVIFRQRLAELEQESGRSMQEQLATFRESNSGLAARAGILWHTFGRGVRHPVRAGRMVIRSARQRLGG
ncbi:MAG: hypothetical protein QF402_04420 [Candidatus Latescibacteria bacterium]|nr:hypothetical protein [Candidatus Latescibacterota bacterium]